MATAAERFAAWAADLTCERIPGPVIEAAKLHALDAIGCGLAAHGLGEATAAREAMRELGGAGRASVIGLRERLSEASAAFANGMLCHALDFDDTHADSVCHVSAVIVPAAVAAGEALGAGGRELVAAMVAANEVVTRIGMAAPAAFHRRGFHPTSVCGVFGAAAAAARLAALDSKRTSAALGIAGSLASGIFEYLADGSQTKPIHAGWAAQAGILASRLAAHGGSGPASVLEGRYGLYATFADLHDVRLEPQTADLGSRWETLRIAFKPYPACHFVHSVIDAAALATRRRSVSAEEIREIVVAVPEPEVPVVLEPLAEKAAPRTAYDAKFSLPFNVAAFLLRRRIDLDTYRRESIRHPRTLELARKVRYEPAEFPTHPKAFPGRIRIALRDGTALEAEVPYQRGGPENPMSAEEVREKFRANASLALGEQTVARIEQSILTLERQRDLRAVFSALGEETPGR